MGKCGIFHVFWGFVFGYVSFCFAGCMVAGIFGLVKERRDFLFCVSEGGIFGVLFLGCVGDCHNLERALLTLIILDCGNILK